MLTILLLFPLASLLFPLVFSSLSIFLIFCLGYVSSGAPGLKHQRMDQFKAGASDGMSTWYDRGKFKVGVIRPPVKDLTQFSCLNTARFAPLTLNPTSLFFISLLYLAFQSLTSHFVILF